MFGAVIRVSMPGSKFVDSIPPIPEHSARAALYRKICEITSLTHNFVLLPIGAHIQPLGWLIFLWCMFTNSVSLYLFGKGDGKRSPFLFFLNCWGPSSTFWECSLAFLVRWSMMGVKQVYDNRNWMYQSTLRMNGLKMCDRCHLMSYGVRAGVYNWHFLTFIY